MRVLFVSGAALLALSLGVDSSRPKAGPPENFLHDYYSAYNAQGAARLGDFYAPEATFTDPSFGLNLHGRQQISDLLVRALAKYERLEHEVKHTVTSGEELVVEGEMVAMLNGKPLRVSYVSVFTFANGKIVAQRDLYDLIHYFEQLGVVPQQFRPK
jgi:ketosteroid isomerase-like protein